MNRLAKLRRRLLHEESGFSMVVVTGVLAVSAMFLAAGFAAADGDLPALKGSKDRKQAYAAAEAGLAYYRFQLLRDNDFWTHCDNVPGPSAGVPAPITQAGATDRRWRTLPGSTARYTIELLPAKGKTACVESDQSSMLDKSTGTFRIRATGRAGGVTRSIVATFRRATFLDYLYFTDFETTDPSAYPTAAQRSVAQLLCADRYRPDRGGSCSEIQFREPDQVKGPLHSNDSLLTCNKPVFGRDVDDAIEVSASAPGFVKNCTNVDPTFKGTFKFDQTPLKIPTSNSELKNVTGADKFTGRTTIRLNNTQYTAVKSDGSSVTRTIPASGVIYVDNGTNCTGTTPPVVATYSESSGCAIVELSGTYSKPLTIGSAGDILIKPPTGTTNGDVIHANDAILGLIAENFIRVYHPVSGCENDTSRVMPDVRIDAALLALNHSITVDNYSCGDRLGNLAINGAMAQVYRGAVGTSGSRDTGYIKDYDYDDRLRYRSPPYFLTPVDAAWKVIKLNEQVPAAA
jgi:hypothetical protein